MEIVELNAKDFRLGNKLYYSKKIVDVDFTALITLNSILKFGEGFNFYQPIPLTEEILLKCKGVKSSYTSNPELIGASKKYDLGSIIIFQPNEDESVFYTCINEYMDNLIVDALHQLQNLYFALTGQELEINL